MSLSSLLAVTMMTGISRGGRLVLEAPADLEPVDAGQHHVEQDEVGQLATDEIQSFFAVGLAGELVAFFFQVVADDLEDVGLVFDRDDLLFRHGGLRVTQVRAQNVLAETNTAHRLRPNH